MAIQGTVGKSGSNKFCDVKLAQALFNLNWPRFPDVMPNRQKTDELIGNNAIDSQTRFRTEVMGCAQNTKTV